MATSAPPSELVLKFSCPSCGHRLTMPVRKAGLQAPCPKCAHQVSAPPIDNSVSGYDAIAAAVKASMPPPPVSPLPAHTPPPRPQPAPPPPPVKETVDEIPAHSHPAPVADPVVGRTHRGGFAFPWRARWTGWMLYVGILFILSLLYKAVGESPLVMVLFGGWLFLGRYVTLQFLLPIVYSSFVCPGCHEVHDAVGHWNCSCGYVPHRTKHLFHKCPECAERGGKTKCPRCGVSMLIW